MTHRTDDILQVLHGLIAMYPDKSEDRDWLAQEAASTHGIDPKAAARVYDKRLRIWEAG